jgi:hypothetical protein
MYKSTFIILTQAELDAVIDASVEKAMFKFSSALTKPKLSPEYLTRKETVEILKISYPTLWKQTKSGSIDSFKIGKRVLYHLDDVHNLARKMNFKPKSHL